MLIKIILITAVLLVAFFLTRAQAGDKGLAMRRLLLAGFVVCAILTILFPDLTTRLAHVLGVGRGTDLLIYALVVAFLSYAVTMYRRLNQQEARLTVLARKLAILEAELEKTTDSKDVSC